MIPDRLIEKYGGWGYGIDTPLYHWFRISGAAQRSLCGGVVFAGWADQRHVRDVNCCRECWKKAAARLDRIAKGKGKAR
jgi:hypothetical protein